LAQYQNILPTVEHIKFLAQLHINAENTLSSRMDAQVTASTDADADYAAEVVDGRISAWGDSLGSLGGNIREGQLRMDLALHSEEVCRTADDNSLQRQINSLAEAVLEVLAIISENREKGRNA